MNILLVAISSFIAGGIFMYVVLNDGLRTDK